MTVGIRVWRNHRPHPTRCDGGLPPSLPGCDNEVACDPGANLRLRGPSTSQGFLDNAKALGHTADRVFVVFFSAASIEQRRLNPYREVCSGPIFQSLAVQHWLSSLASRALPQLSPVFSCSPTPTRFGGYPFPCGA